MSKEKFTFIMFEKIQVISYKLSYYYKISYNEALDFIYHSKLYKALENEETKMWYFSSEQLFKMLMEEKETGNYIV